MSTGLATLASPGSTSRERGARLRRASSGSSRPAASHASAQRIPSPPAFVSTPTRRPRGSGWLESSAGHVDQLLERLARGSRRPGGRARRPPPRSRRAPPCASSPRVAPGRGRAGLQREDRLAARDPAREARELARVAERLEVEQHDVRVRVVLPPLEQVVRGDVRLVPDRDEGREAEPRSSLLEQREAERAALRREADRARAAARAARRSRSAAASCDGDPEAVRPEQPRAVRADEREQLLLPLARPRRRSRRSRPRSRRARARPSRSASSAASSTCGARQRRSTARSIVVGDLVDRARSRARRRRARRRG